MGEGCRDFTPAPWAPPKDDFKEARKNYDKTAGRTYAKAIQEGKTEKDLTVASIKVGGESVVALAFDNTGSIGNRAGIISGKAPYLDVEGRAYLGDDAKYVFMSFKDKTYTRVDAGLQVRPPTSGKGIRDELAFFPAMGGGGGNFEEDAAMALLYGARMIEVDSDTKNKIFVIVTDEKTQETISASEASDQVGVSLRAAISLEKVVAELKKKKFSVYAIVMPYGISSTDSGPSRSQMDANTRSVYNFWKDLLGEEYIAYMPIAERILDVLFGIFAKETGKTEYWAKEILARQKDEGTKQIEWEKVEAAQDALSTIFTMNLRKVAAAAEKTAARPGKKKIGRSILAPPPDVDGEEADTEAGNKPSTRKGFKKL